MDLTVVECRVSDANREKGAAHQISRSGVPSSALGAVAMTSCAFPWRLDGFLRSGAIRDWKYWNGLATQL
jgi:hypothetical protein